MRLRWIFKSLLRKVYIDLDKRELEELNVEFIEDINKTYMSKSVIKNKIILKRANNVPL